MRKIIILLLLMPLSIKAACTSGELSPYKTLSSQVNTYYDYNEQTNKFKITVYNISDKLKIKKGDNEYFGNGTIGETIIDNLEPGQNVTLGIYPRNGECAALRIQTLYVNLPYYNEYYKDEVCINNKNILCSKWANTKNYTYEQFKKEVSSQQKQQEEIKEPEPEIEKYTFLEFLGDFYIPILLLIIISGSIAIYYLDKKSKFDF